VFFFFFLLFVLINLPLTSDMADSSIGESLDEKGAALP